MKRPDEQWFAAGWAAKRVRGSEPEEWFSWCSTTELPWLHAELLIEQAKEGEQRMEGFELVNCSSQEVVGWAVLSPEVQLFSTTLQSTSASNDDLINAALAWLIARGASALNAYWADGSVLATYPSDSEVPLIDWLNIRLRACLGCSNGDEWVKLNSQRLITLAPSNLEIVEALGCLDRLIACEDSSDLPEGWGEHMVRLGPDLNPNLDHAATLAPDLIISSLSVPGMERIVTRLAVLGKRQLVLAPRSLDEVISDIRLTALVLNVEIQGAKVIAQLIKERDDLLARRPSTPLPVFLEWWPKPIYTPGSTCFSNEIIELAGGVNVFKHRHGSSIEISPVELVEAEPAIYFISWCGVPLDKLNPDKVRKREGLAQLNEVARDNIIPIDEAFTGRPGPKMLEASRLMSVHIRRVLGE